MGRISRLAAGMVLILVGIVLIPLPGPGLLLVAGGLAILGRDHLWARQILNGLKHRYRRYLGKEFPDDEETGSSADQDGG